MSSPRTSTDSPAVEVQGLRKSFGRHAVLASLDLRVERGEFVVIVGPSGAGKSTLLHLLAGLDKPDAGTIVVDGTDLSHARLLTRYRRTKVGLIFQLHNLIPRLTAVQNVEMALFDSPGWGRDHRARSSELLQAVGLGHRLHQYPPTLSGGERQRVAVARALANQPNVLLADEPTGSLDDASAGEVLALFKQIQTDTGHTIVAVSHDPRLNRVADRLVYLTDGQIRATPPARAASERAAELVDELAHAADVAAQAGLGQAASWIDRHRPRRSRQLRAGD